MTHAVSSELSSMNSISVAMPIVESWMRFSSGSILPASFLVGTMMERARRALGATALTSCNIFAPGLLLFHHFGRLTTFVAVSFERNDFDLHLHNGSDSPVLSF